MIQQMFSRLPVREWAELCGYRKKAVLFACGVSPEHHRWHRKEQQVRQPKCDLLARCPSKSISVDLTVVRCQFNRLRDPH